MTDADFIVCGAGPAGSTAAKYLAEKEHSVLLLDRGDFPRDKACGGGLCPHVLKFEHVKESLNEYLEGVCTRGMIFSPSMKGSIDHRSESPLFYNIRRKTFDHKLVQFALEKGAELRKAHVKETREDEKKATVVLTDGSELTAKALVGATGPYDPVSRYVRAKHSLPAAWEDNEIGTILVHEFEVGKDFLDDVYGEERTALIHLQTAGLLRGSYGYGWVFSKTNVLNIGYGGFKRDMKRIDIGKTFSDYLDVLRRDGYFPEEIELEEFTGAPLPLDGYVKKTYYNRMLIAGDAAGFVSPISGEGIYFAMDSGRIAAEVLDRAARRNDFSTQALSEYQGLWRRAWGRDLWMLRLFANRLMAWPEAIIRYGQKDEVLKKYLVEIFTGTRSAYKLKFRIAGRVAGNFILRR